MVAVRTAFDRQLRMLENDVLRLAELVETQLMGGVRALQSRDVEAARQIDAFDASLNKLRYEIEEQAYILLALQQPTAGDMRRIVASVSIATNLERMGDHAANVARVAVRTEGKTEAIHIPAFDDMARLASENLHNAMIAMQNADAPLARSVVSRDAEIDRLHKSTYDMLIAAMINKPALVEVATQLLWVSHDIERFADRICNICERIVYMVTGNLHEPRVDPMP